MQNRFFNIDLCVILGKDKWFNAAFRAKTAAEGKHMHSGRAEPVKPYPLRQKAMPQTKIKIK